MIRTTVFLFAYLFAIARLFCVEPESSKSVLFSKEIAGDASPAVYSRLLTLSGQSAANIKFEKGTYHFYPDKAHEQFCYMSNHCDLMLKIAFPLNGQKNITIDGQGSTFIFHGVMVPFLVENSENITLKNLTIDWADPFCSEGLIVARDTVKGTFDMKIADSNPYEIRNNQLIFIKPYYEHTIGQSILYDPARKAIAFDTESYTPLTTTKKNSVQFNVDKINYKYDIDFRAPEFKYIGSENRLVAEELAPGLVRIYNHTKKIPPLGFILSMKGEQGFNRVAPAIRVVHAKGFLAENVTVNHAGGMGIIAENSTNLTLNRFNVTPSNGRMVSTTADATHFVGCRGKIEIKNCILQNQLDDGMNVHGTYQIVQDILDEYRIGVRMGHHQQQGFVIGDASDTLGLVRLSNSFDPYGQVTIKSIQYINSRYQIITFNQKVPASLKTGDLIENLSAYPEVLVENCTINNNRARGLLISTPRKTVVHHNLFSTEMEAILIPVESGSWYESGNGANITIEDNTFQDCVHSGQSRGVIRLETDEESNYVAFRNITIRNNTFNQSDNQILEVSNVDGLTFEGNTITNSGTFPQLFPESPVFTVKSSKNVVFRNNKYEGNAKLLVEKDKSVPNLKFR